MRKSLPGELHPKATSIHVPPGLPTVPQRALFRTGSIGVFRSLSDSSDIPQPRQHPLGADTSCSDNVATLDEVDSVLALTHQDNDESARAKSDWEIARLEELSQEIRKLLGSSASSSVGTTPLVQPHVDTVRKTAGESVGVSEQAGSSSDQARLSSAKGPSMPERDSVLEGLDLSQPLNLYRVPDGVMQVFIMSIQPSSPVSRAYVVIRLGEQVYQTSVAKTPAGSWNEGFELIVSYHMQLFGTVHLDVYSSNTLLPDTHVGRAEVKLSMLGGFPEIFTNYYEIWDRKLTASTVPEQRQRQVLSKNLGALQVRINYRYQKPEDPEPIIAKVRGAHIAGTVPNQLVNRISDSRDQAGSAEMSTEELVKEFSSEYSQYMEMVRKHGHRAIVRNPLASDGTESAVGFTKVDDDAIPLGMQPPESTTPPATAPKNTIGMSGWFTEIFASSTTQQQQHVPQQPPLSSNSAGSQIQDAVTETAGVAQPSKSGRKDSSQATEAGGVASERTLMQSLTSMFISPSTFMAIKSIDRLIGTFNQGVELSNAELLGGLLTLYKFYNEADIPGISDPLRGHVVESVPELEQPGRYARFALASYGWRALYFFNRGITLMDGAKVDSDVTSVLQYLNMAPEDLLGYEFRSSQLFCPSYFVAHDRQHKAVVLVVRGTMSAEDTVVDLSCEYTKWNGGLVHSGIKASAQWLFINVMPQMLAYAKSQGIGSIRIVGHSLGASTAAILTIMVQSVREQLGEHGVDCAEFDIKAYCYGPAPCISDDIAERFRDGIETYVNMDDLVPRLCYGSVTDFKRMSISAADEADNLAQRLYAPFEDLSAQQQRWNDRFSRLLSIRESILATQENLHLALPGAIHHIVAYRGTAGKDKKLVRNLDLDVVIGKRELFGAKDPLLAPDEGERASISEGAITPEHRLQQPPPPTPATKVQSDSVNTEDLVEAINTSLSDSVADAQTPSSGGDGARSSTRGAPPYAASSQSSDKFYPVWVQRVPNNHFREILLRPTIITDHMPSAYELAFAHAIETQIREKRLRDKSKRSQGRDA
ncbi:hypothetical protein GGI04_001122 [Coemansia thaxteri]|nr:hypothetical protein GGI04_001122 [Coemansia thaxteri]KAJ2472715.1 hypothetical protein GGI02_001386 [Coemansia sp. RSA 2322]